MLAVYVSGHGYGHATRTAEVLRVLRERAPGLPIAVNTSVPASLFEGIVAPPFELRHVECDVGLVQRDALVIDEQESLARWRAFDTGWRALVAAEARWLRERGARLVLGDIPPLAFAAAAEADVPSVALGNFSWDWIYRHLARRRAGFEEAALAAAAAYARAGLLLRLPFAGDLSAFPRCEDVPLVARRPRVGKTDARRRLGLEPARPAVLFSFGGLGMQHLGLPAPSLGEYQLLATGRGAAADPGGQLRVLDGTTLAAVGLDYPELVGAADVVVTKPGYGIVTDCIGAATRLVYTDRGDFPEYPIMVAEMKGYLPARYVTNDEIRTGRISHALEQVLLEPWPAVPDLSGAARVADRLLGTL